MGRIAKAEGKYEGQLASIDPATIKAALMVGEGSPAVWRGPEQRLLAG
jgi:hypothetical protein